MLLTFAGAIPFLLCIIIPIKKKYRYFSSLLVTIFYLLIFVPSLRQDHRLAKYGVQQTGVLTSKNCDINSNNVAERNVEDHVLGAAFGFFALYLCLLWLGNEQEKFRNKKAAHPKS